MRIRLQTILVTDITLSLVMGQRLIPCLISFHNLVFERQVHNYALKTALVLRGFKLKVPMCNFKVYLLSNFILVITDVGEGKHRDETWTHIPNQYWPKAMSEAWLGVPRSGLNFLAHKKERQNYFNVRMITHKGIATQN